MKSRTGTGCIVAAIAALALPLLAYWASRTGDPWRPVNPIPLPDGCSLVRSKALDNQWDPIVGSKYSIPESATNELSRTLASLKQETIDIGTPPEIASEPWWTPPPDARRGPFLIQSKKGTSFLEVWIAREGTNLFLYTLDTCL